jgi:thiamine-monophosphate kinase
VSRVSARVYAGEVPLSKAGKAALQAEPALLEAVLTGGDDYEILAAVPPELAERFEAAGVQVNVPVTRIGEITRGSKPPQFLDPNGRELRLRAPGFEHFKS